MSQRAAGVALLLVDLQNDYLERAGLVPDAASIRESAARLLAAARRAGVPVVHANTVVRADGSDRMPHWIEDDVWQCVEGTRGAAPPPELAPVAGELVLRKRYFSAFGDDKLDPWLRQRGVSTLAVAGVYLHGCVRSTVLDAYERGYRVIVADDAVGSTEPVHAEISRAYLRGRAAAFARTDAVVRDLEGGHSAGGDRRAEIPAAVIAGVHRSSPGAPRFLHFDPCASHRLLAEVPLGGEGEIRAAALACEHALRDWSRTSALDRADLLDHWALELEARRSNFVDLMVREVAKPRRAAEEEAGRAVAHARIAAELARDPSHRSSVAPGVVAARRPHGVVGLITPWNNPFAIPVGKIAPALACGNAVVLKPAPQAPATALAILDSLARAALPTGTVNLVFGDAATALALCREPRIGAVSVTGSLAAGRTVAAACAIRLIPLQAELGGNNAAIVLADADLEAEVPGLLRAAFGFAGQRCTATRRFIVERRACARFEDLVCRAMEGLVIGRPDDPTTEIGPVISAAKRDAVAATVDRALSSGARLVGERSLPRGLEGGAWMPPALVAGVAPDDPIAREETFGPVAVLLPAEDLEEALRIANGVEQGLLVTVHTRDRAARARVLEAAEAGIVQVASGPLAVHPRAPFSGWKASGLGPPEHGVWDAAFYARIQAVYGDDAC